MAEGAASLELVGSVSVFDQLAAEDVPANARDQELPDGIDMEILRNPQHPQWEAMRARYEERLLAQHEREEMGQF
jgi:hypothetical protein